jgi:hypothetical protein
MLPRPRLRSPLHVVRGLFELNELALTAAALVAAVATRALDVAATTAFSSYHASTRFAYTPKHPIHHCARLFSISISILRNCPAQDFSNTRSSRRRRRRRRLVYGSLVFLLHFFNTFLDIRIYPLRSKHINSVSLKCFSSRQSGRRRRRRFWRRFWRRFYGVSRRRHKIM